MRYDDVTAKSPDSDGQPVGILFVHYGDDWIRGSERCLLDLLTHLNKEQFTPVLWCNSQILADEASALGIPVYCSKFSLLLGWQRPLFDIKAFGRLVSQGRKLVTTHQIKLIHANSGGPNQWLNFVVRSEGIPLVAHLHARYPLRDRLTLGLHQVAMVVGVSEPVAEQLRQDGSRADRIRVIANGIDADKQDHQLPCDLRTMLGLRIQDFLIVTTGSLIERKGIDLIIDAVEIMAGRGIPARLAIIGDGPERVRLEEQVRQLSMNDTIHFLGERSNVAGLLRGGVDLFVSGAREEVFGLALAEASLAGVAVVAPKVGGIPSVVVDGKTGLLVEPENSNALAEAMDVLYVMPERRRLMGDAGRDHVLNNFTIARNIQSFEELYRQLLNTAASQMRWYSHWQLRYPLLNSAKRLLHLAKARLLKVDFGKQGRSQRVL